jgi:hypothetical protein
MIILNPNKFFVGNVMPDFDGKAGRKEPLARPRHRWEYNIEMDLRETRRDGMDWFGLARDRD